MANRKNLQSRRHLARSASSAVTSVVLAVVFAAGPAHAQSAEAEALFDEGDKLMAAGKIAQACDAFEASNRIEPTAGTLIRLGECREQNQQLASAWTAYQEALLRVKDPHKREVAVARAATVESRVSRVTVSVPDHSRVEGLTITWNGVLLASSSWNRSLPIDGGDYLLAVRVPGRADWQTTVHVPVSWAKIGIEVPRFADPSAPTSSGAFSKSSQRFRAENDRRWLTTRRKVALGVAASSVVSAAAGIVLGTIAQHKRDEAFAQCPEPATPCPRADQANAVLQTSHRRALEANIGFGIAAAAAIGAGVLWFSGAPAAENATRVSVVPHPALGEATVVVVGRF